MEIGGLLSLKSNSRFSDVPVGIRRWFRRMVCAGWATILRYFKWGRDTARPGGASEDFGNASCRYILRRKEARSKKLRSRVTDILLLGTWRRSNVKRFGKFVQSRLAVTPDKRNSRKDEKFPSKIVS